MTKFTMAYPRKDDASGPGLGFVTLPLMETEAPSLQGASAQWVRSVGRAFPCVPTPGTRQQGGR